MKMHFYYVSQKWFSRMRGALILEVHVILVGVSLWGECREGVAATPPDSGKHAMSVVGGA